MSMIEHRSIVGKIKKPPQYKPFPFGFRGGVYLGAPGKDIYFILDQMSDEQMNSLSNRLFKQFPRDPPGNHVKWAACIRYIYGCFEKQGCLRSKKDKKRIIDENPEWDLPIKFMNEVAYHFKKKKHIYGLVLHYEMLAHRFGDRAIINKDARFLQKMTEYYERSQSLALKCKSWKHTFTPFYWAGHYYYEMKDKENAVKYHKLNLKFMEKYCPDARPGYRDKAKMSIKHIKKSISDREWKEFYRWLRKRKNKCLRKVV